MRVTYGLTVRAYKVTMQCKQWQFSVYLLTFYKETNPAWPHTDLYESVSVWLEKGRALDVIDFGE
jgi:hypothetical protein